MNDLIFPENWKTLNVAQFVTNLVKEFDSINLFELPNYTLLDKIRLAGMLLALLTNDPLKNERSQLVADTLAEIHRQAAALVAEYANRADKHIMWIDCQPRSFLSSYMNDASNPAKPPPVTVGMRSLEMGSSIGRSE